jgi:NAD(P)-dependent dehydrogenase (short-subunit alcohol dehydrogenase family)
MGNRTTMAPWTSADITDQTGRTFVVTGANSGLGLVTARDLVAHGARVVLACRNTDKGEQAAADITRGGVPGSTAVEALDLSDLASVRRFAARVGPVDVLVNNAGLMAVPQQRTTDGFEMQFGTNVLGHFALTGLLLDRLTDRVVWMSSVMHRIGSIRLDDLNWERRRYQRWLAYGQSKLADLMLAYDLAYRLVAAGSPLRSVAAHPGYSATNLQSRTESFQDALMGLGNRFFAQGPDMGALPELYAATVPDLPGGTYVGPDGWGESSGHPIPVGSTASSHDRDVQRALFTACEELTGVTMPVPAGVR